MILYVDLFHETFLLIYEITVVLSVSLSARLEAGSRPQGCGSRGCDSAADPARCVMRRQWPGSPPITASCTSAPACYNPLDTVPVPIPKVQLWCFIKNRQPAYVGFIGGSINLRIHEANVS